MSPPTPSPTPSSPPPWPASSTAQPSCPSPSSARNWSSARPPTSSCSSASAPTRSGCWRPATGSSSPNWNRPSATPSTARALDAVRGASGLVGLLVEDAVLDTWLLRAGTVQPLRLLVGEQRPAATRPVHPLRLLLVERLVPSLGPLRVLRPPGDLGLFTRIGRRNVSLRLLDRPSHPSPSWLALISSRPVGSLVHDRLGGETGVGGRALGCVPGAVVGGGLLGGALLGGGDVVADLPGALDMGAEPGAHRVALGHADGAARLIGAGGDRVGVGQRGVATRARLLGLAADHAGVALLCLVTAVGHPSVVAVHRDLLSVVQLVSGRGPAQTPARPLPEVAGTGGGGQRQGPELVGDHVDHALDPLQPPPDEQGGGAPADPPVAG